MHLSLILTASNNSNDYNLNLHKLLMELITRMSGVITPVGDTYCARGIYLWIIDEFLTWEK